MNGPQAKTPWTSLYVETARRPWDNGPKGHGRAERRRKRRTFHPRHSVPPPMPSVVTAREMTDAERRAFRRKGR